MEALAIEQAAYDRLLELASSADPEPSWGVLSGRDGVVRSIYPLSPAPGCFERIGVTDEAALDIRQTVAGANECLMGFFSSRRSVAADGRSLLMSPPGSAWVPVVMGDTPLPWLSVDVDLSPLLGGAPRVNPVMAAVISSADSSDPNWWRRVEVRVLENSPAWLGEDGSTEMLVNDLDEDRASEGGGGSFRIGVDLRSGRPVRLGLIDRRQGLYIIGKSGVGKSTLLESLIVQDMEAGHGLCVLDPHGDLVDAVLRNLPASREADVILIDLADSDYPFGLNIFECRDMGDRNLKGRVATQAVEVFEKQWGELSWGPQLAQILRNCAYTLVDNQGYSLADVRRLLLDDKFRADLVKSVSHQQVREFWELEYDPLRAHEQQQLVRSTLNKIDEFLTPAVYPIVGWGKTTIDFRRIMDDGKILLLRLSQGPVGAPTVDLIGSMIVGQFYNAALSRENLPPADRRQFNLYADEYERFATPTFSDLLEQARKYAIATTLAHQTRSQLSDRSRGATLVAGNILVFGVHGEDADELAKQFDRTPPPPEVAGLRPKLSVCQDAIGHLLRSGHEDAEIRWLVQHRLMPWAHLANSETTKDEVEVPTCAFGDRGDFMMAKARANPSKIKEGLQLLNSYFVHLMEGRTEYGSHAEALALNGIVEALRGLIGCADGQDVWVPTGWNRTVEPWEKEHFTYALFLRYIAAYVKDPDQAKLGREREAVVARRRRTNGDKEEYGLGDGEVHSLDFHLQWIREIGRRLAQAPIMIDSGQWEPYFDKPRTYSDVEAEIASKLVSLPKYHARYRLLDGTRTVEGIVATPDYRSRSVGAEQLDMIARIRDRSRANYCAPLETVLSAIAQRQSERGGNGDDTSIQPRAQRRVRLGDQGLAEGGASSPPSRKK